MFGREKLRYFGKTDKTNWIGFGRLPGSIPLIFYSGRSGNGRIGHRLTDYWSNQLNWLKQLTPGRFPRVPVLSA